MALDERKTAQMAALFVQNAGGQMSHLKLMKLLYLADRESFRLRGRSISGDRMVAMPHGPVLSGTLELINGCAPSAKNGWESYIGARENHQVALVAQVVPEYCEKLNPEELEIIAATWDAFGRMGRWEIRDYTHNHCREWVDPDGSSIPITPYDVLLAVGYGDSAATEMAENIAAQERADRDFYGR